MREGLWWGPSRSRSPPAHADVLYRAGAVRVSQRKVETTLYQLDAAPPEHLQKRSQKVPGFGWGMNPPAALTDICSSEYPVCQEGRRR
jgi:hypothetical protein